MKLGTEQRYNLFLMAILGKIKCIRKVNGIGDADLSALLTFVNQLHSTVHYWYAGFLSLNPCQYVIGIPSTYTRPFREGI